IFGQADRLIVGAMLGSSAVAYYSVCTQVAQPVHGLVASAFNFLFPHLSTRHETGKSKHFRETLIVSVCLNVPLFVILLPPLVLCSKLLLTKWMGAPFAEQTWLPLTIVAGSYALVGLNVSGHYALMALGAVRYVMYVNLAAGIAMVAAIAFLAFHFGLTGAA